MNNESTNLASDISPLVAEMRRRASSTRRFAKLSIVGIVAAVAIMIIFFSTSGVIPSFIGGFFPFSVEPSYPRFSEELVSESETVAEAVRHLEDQIESVRQQVQSQDVMLSISQTIIRIASVFLAVYLIQILVGFTRYQFRVADHLDATGDALEISQGDPDALQKLVSVLAPQHIEFGKMPRTPGQHSMDVIRELAKKVPRQ